MTFDNRLMVDIWSVYVRYIMCFFINILHSLWELTHPPSDLAWARGCGTPGRLPHHDNVTDSTDLGPACSTGSPAIISNHIPVKHNEKHQHLFGILRLKTTPVRILAYLAGKAVRMERELARPHDQSGRRDWLEAASTLPSSEHPVQQEKWR